MAPFCSCGVAHRGKKTANQYPRLWLSSPRVSIFWAVMVYIRASNLWTSQPDFFAER
jgi:hypothetical protein